MVVLYGSLLFIFVYLTYLTQRSRKKSHEIKRLKVAAKEYLFEIATLKAKLNGKASKKTIRSEQKHESAW